MHITASLHPTTALPYPCTHARAHAHTRAHAHKHTRPARRRGRGPHAAALQVIGLLGGTWSADKRQLVVIEAYPCRRAEGSDAVTSVELDPMAQIEVQHVMESRGQRCVGW